MRVLPNPLVACYLGVLVAACSSPPAADAPAWVDPSPHTVGEVAVNGARLNYLDWGGTGPALVLIHGLGDSPHVWDDLAPLLTSSFRVVAYARRGHAHSSMAGPYDNETLTDDLRGLLDSLRIERANLLGWSMGGNEITEFAGRYPDRTIALVYLDAAYDWADPRLGAAFDASPVSLTPGPADLASLDVLRSWFQQTWLAGVDWPPSWEAHMRDLVDEQPDGSVHYRQSDSINVAMFGSLMAYAKDYTRIKAPALGLFAPIFFPPGADSTRAAALAQWEASMFEPYRAASIARFRREVAVSQDTLLPNTNHASIGVVDVNGVAGVVRGFLVAHQR
ncbi:MAG: alpha/beta hydrolase [Gemmatimonadetes bacterium]|nr:alpha/beta hydrolase [Gemmatimonadota bacterium]